MLDSILLFTAVIGVEEEDLILDCRHVALLHEIQLLNRMLDTTRELLENCMNAMMGRHVVTEEVERIMEAITSNSILQQVQVYHTWTFTRILVSDF